MGSNWECPPTNRPIHGCCRPWTDCSCNNHLHLWSLHTIIIIIMFYKKKRKEEGKA
jgi:hypothetical protein